MVASLAFATVGKRAEESGNVALTKILDDLEGRITN